MAKLDRQDEDKLRHAAFRMYYDKIYRDELDMTVRFAKSIIDSAGPIRDPEALRKWMQMGGKKAARYRPSE